MSEDTAKKEKRLFTEALRFDINLELPLTELISRLGDYLYEAESKGFTNVRVDEEEYGDYKQFNIVGDRPETDYEEDCRVRREYADIKREEDHQRELYEKLRKKFEDPLRSPTKKVLDF